MKCTRCGAEYEGANACPNCGQFNEAPAAKKEDITDVIIAKVKSFLKPKNFIILGVAILALLLIGSVLRVVIDTSGLDKYGVQLSIVPDSEGTAHFLAGSKELKDTLENVSDYGYSADRSVAIIADEDGALYVLKSSGLKETKVDEGCSYIMQVSYDGTGVLYYGEEGEIFLYNVKNKKNVEVTDEDVENYALSPDGDVLVYTLSEDGDIKMYYFNGKESTYLAKGLEPISVDNSGKYIYAVGEDNLYRLSRKGDDKEKLSSCSSSSFYMNNDCTQIMFSDEGKTYLSIKGKEPYKLNGAASSSLIVPNGVISYASNGDTDAYLFGCDNILDMLFRADGNIYTYNKKGDKEKVASDADDYIWTEDCKYLIYTDGDTIYKKTVDSSKDAKELTDEYNSSMVVSPDGKFIYFTDDTGTLYGIKGTGKAKSITDDFDDYTLTQKGVLLVTVDGELHACTNGKKLKKIADADDVMECEASYGVAIYITEDGEFFASNGSKKFKQVLKDVEIGF